MDIPTPIQLSFIKHLNIFQEIKFLDQQYKVQLDRHYKRNRFDSEDSKDRNYPLWEIEKKILLWTFLGHKHLGSLLLLNSMDQEEFRRDAYISDFEYQKAKAEKPFGNLVERGYAEWKKNSKGKGIKVSNKGRMVGVIIAFTQKLREKNNEVGYKMWTFERRSLGWFSYQLLLVSTYFLLFMSVFLLASTFLGAIHLMDDVIKFLADSYLLISSKILVFMFVLLTISGFVVAIVLIFVNQWKVIHKLSKRKTD